MITGKGKLHYPTGKHFCQGKQSPKNLKITSEAGEKRPNLTTKAKGEGE